MQIEEECPICAHIIRHDLPEERVRQIESIEDDISPVSFLHFPDDRAKLIQRKFGVRDGLFNERNDAFRYGKRTITRSAFQVSLIRPQSAIGFAFWATEIVILHRDSGSSIKKVRIWGQIGKGKGWPGSLSPAELKIIKKTSCFSR